MVSFVIPYLRVRTALLYRPAGAQRLRPLARTVGRKHPSRITIALDRLERGNLSNAKSVGSGVSELRLNFGPGYRIYFGRDGATLIILLGGGTKKRQQRDIELAQALWREYKQRKREE